MPVRRALCQFATAFTLLLVMGLAVNTTAPAFASPTMQSDLCPITTTDVLSGVVGQPVSIDSMLVSNSGPRDECIFESGEGILLVGRQTGYFSSVAMTPESLSALSRAGVDLAFTPETGVGDEASWVQAADPELRAERLSVLVVRRGADAFFFGLDQSVFSDVMNLTKTVALAVIASAP